MDGKKEFREVSMDLGAALSISASGLDAQRRRMNVVASNLANASTTRTPEGGPYKRRDVVFEAAPATFEDALNSKIGEAKGVMVTEVVEDKTSPKMVYEPSHPDANKDGYVAFPNINVIEEMTNMMAATRSYESNVAAINATKSMSMKALEIGK